MKKFTLSVALCLIAAVSAFAPSAVSVSAQVSGSYNQRTRRIFTAER